jgi:XTP/dITP diphosphohydrolase
MTELLLATRNAHKAREFAALLGSSFALRDLTSQTNVPEIVESGSSFEENAAIKALAVSRLFPGEIIVADDSGLEVDALGGAPGVRSARYAGNHASDQENIEKLLRELQSRTDHVSARRSARLSCVIAVAKDGELLATIAGDIAGNIAISARGTNGFGYDSAFVPQGFSQTFAELSPEIKNRISHRARAARKLTAFLRAARR